MTIKIGDRNFFNPLEGKIDEIIEYFVKFYGEKYRDRIENRIKNITFLFVPNFDYLQVPSKQIIKLLKKEQGIEDKTLDFSIFLEKLKKREPSHFNGPKLEIDPVTERKLEIIKKNEDEIDKLKEEYKNNVTTIFKKHFPLCESIGFSFLTFELLKRKAKGGFERFNENNRNELLKQATELGYNFENFEQCVNNREFVGKYFGQALEDEIQKEKHKLANLCIQNPLFAENLDKIINLNSQDGDLEIVQFMYEMAFGGITAPAGFAYTYLDKSNNPQFLNMFSLSQFGTRNVTIIHEINHVIETNVFNIGKTGFDEKCGFDVVRNDYVYKYFTGDNLFDGEKVLDNGTEENRKYEKLNEAINDYLAQKVCSLMKESGFDLVDDKWETASDYRFGFMFVRDIVDNNLDTIIQCRMSEDPNAMAKIIGQENFDRWAEIVDYWMMKPKQDVPEDVKNFIKEINGLISDCAQNLDFESESE